ncbi:uncharacterized protein LOC122256015 [Penaeus japonicus]|uniref:uncharacterized protein LOC122256015 n=1 Tax=Penaeus japonicus TaxID=27405 RepID=UPI001C710016|nr:uncharacterized protein LOC122256015 [Penaeus japonicus]
MRSGKSVLGIRREDARPREAMVGGALAAVQMFLLLALVLVASPAEVATGARTAQLAPAPAERDGLPGVDMVLGTVIATVSQDYNSFIVFTDGTNTEAILKGIGDAVDLSGVAIMEVPDQSFNTSIKRLISQARKSCRLMVRKSFRGMTVVVASEDPDFLSAFAEWADEGRLAVWDNKILVVTRLARRQLLSLMKDRWIFAMLNTMMLNMDEDDTSAMRYGLYSHFPYGPGGPQTVRVATWTPTRGMVFLTQHPLFPEKYTNFHGAPLALAVWPFPPIVMEEKVVAPNGTESTRLYGRGIRILEAIAGHLNFAIGEQLPVTESKNSMDHVLYGRALFSPQKMAFLPHLARRYDYTFFIEEATLTFCMAKPELKPRWQNLYYPLGDRVWASILALLVLVPAVFFLLHKSRLEGNAKENFSPLLVTEQVLGTLLDPELLPPTSFPLSYALQVIMLPELRINFYPTFKESNSSMSTELIRRTYFMETYVGGMQQALDKGDAFIFERLFLELMIIKNFTKVDGSTPMYVVRENLVPGYAGWLLYRDNPFKRNLDKCILAFHEFGLIQRWSEEVLTEEKKRSHKIRLQEKQDAEATGKVQEKESQSAALQPLSIKHLQGPLFLLVSGLVVGVLVFLAEVLMPWTGSAGGRGASKPSVSPP